MPPTSPSPDDAFDLDGLDMKPSKKKPSAAESDFEKELEALFAEELASSDETPASAPPVGGPESVPVAEPAAEPAAKPAAEPADELLELSLDDLVEDAPAAGADEDEDILDLADYAQGVDLLTPPEDAPGGKDGGIDLAGLDDLISGLGDTSAEPAAPEPAAPASAAPESAAPESAAPESAAPEPLDSTDMADLLESLDLPAAAHAAAAPVDEAEPAEDLLELSLGDLLEEDSGAAPEAEAGLELAAPADDGLLDLTLPDISDPEPGRDLVAEQEQADLGGELNLSLADLDEPAGAAAGVEDILGSDELDMSGLMEGIETAAVAPGAEAEPELSLDPQALLAELGGEEAATAALESDADLAGETASYLVAESASELAAEPAPEPLAQPAPAPPVLEEQPLPMADAALGALAAGSAAAPQEPAPVVLSGEALAAIERRLAELALQVTGGSVAVVRLEGQLAERERALSDLEERLRDSQEEAAALRGELTSLRSQLEAGLEARLAEVGREAEAVREAAQALGARVEGAEKAVAGAAERLAVVEDRQIQLDREIFSEISRAVPREAARVIREEIAALAASMRDE